MNTSSALIGAKTFNDRAVSAPLLELECYLFGRSEATWEETKNVMKLNSLKTKSVANIL